jgi:peptidyl-prolyl cis-trans isomerase D
MAIIGRIRKHSSLAVIIVGVAIAAFVLSDLFKGGGRQNPPVAVINGEDVSYLEYNNQLEQSLENARANAQKDNLTMQEIIGVRNQTWNSILSDYIMGEQLDDLGIMVSSDELFDQVQGTDPHSLIRQYFVDPQTNLYDPELVLRYLQNLDNMDATTRNQWLQLEEFIKKDRREQKYKNMISKGYFIPRPFAELDFESKRKAAEIRYAAASYADISDSLVVVTDEDFERYYEENSYQYNQDASRDIDYVVFDVLPSTTDRKEARELAFRLFEDFKNASDPVFFVNTTSDNIYDSSWFKKGDLPVEIDSLVFNSPVGTYIPPYQLDDAWHFARIMEIEDRPDSMKAEHILIAYAGGLRASPEVTRSREMAQELADSLLNVVKSGGDFAELAKTYSDDPSAQTNNGDLGWFADGMMVYPFNEAVFQGDIGEKVQVESPFGFHVIHITGKKDFAEKARVAIVDRTIEPSSNTDQDVYVEASKFAFENKTLDDFTAAVNEQGLNLRTASYVQQNAYNIPGIENAREIVRWTYYEELEVGQVIQKVFDVEGSYVVAALKEVREEGTVPLDQVRESISTLVYNEKKAEYLIDRIEALGTDDIYTIGNSLNAKVDTSTNLTFSSRNIPGFGSEFKVIGSIFAMTPGNVSGPLQGNGGIFVVALDRFNEPEQSSNLSIYKNQMESSFATRVSGNQVFAALQEDSDIEDNRHLYY